MRAVSACGERKSNGSSYLPLEGPVSASFYGHVSALGTSLKEGLVRSTKVASRARKRK